MTNVKKITASIHQNEIINHYLLLDPKSLYERFNSRFNNYTITKYVESIKDDDICIGIYTKDIELKNKANEFNLKDVKDNILIGFLHLSFEGTSSEIGLSLLQEYQGYGLSNVLMTMALSELALKIKKEKLMIEEVLMHCDSGNKASIFLGKKYGLKVIIDNQIKSTIIPQIKKFTPHL